MNACAPSWTDAYFYAMTPAAHVKQADWREFLRKVPGVGGMVGPTPGSLGDVWGKLKGSAGELMNQFQGRLGEGAENFLVNRLGKAWEQHGPRFLEDPASVLMPLLHKGEGLARGYAQSRLGNPAIAGNILAGGAPQSDLRGSLADMAANALKLTREQVGANRSGLQEAMRDAGFRPDPMRVPKLIVPEARQGHGRVYQKGDEWFFQPHDPISMMLNQARQAIKGRQEQQLYGGQP
jgi:hypothetical protein